jgi:hypothetical protein
VARRIRDPRTPARDAVRSTSQKSSQ